MEARAIIHTMETLIAPFHLKLTDQGTLEEVHGKNLSTTAYSRMKYGVRTDLKQFAHALAKELRIAAPQLYTDSRPPAMLTSYKASAPPATTMARYCLDIINLERFKSGLVPGEMVRVYRPQDYIEEYAILPVSERKKLIGDQSTNTLQGRDLTGYTPVIIDDIHVTGTYTAMMRRVTEQYDNVVLAYLIVCDQTMKDSADAEGKLNSSEIRKPSDLLPYIEKDDFVFTRRFLKMLLRSSVTEVRVVVGTIPDMLLEQIARAIIDTDSELQNIFPKTCKLIFDTAAKRHIF